MCIYMYMKMSIPCSMPTGERVQHVCIYIYIYIYMCIYMYTCVCVCVSRTLRQLLGKGCNRFGHA